MVKKKSSYNITTQKRRELVDTEIKNAVRAADKEAQYDEKAKSLLGHKSILAHILVKTVDVFRGMEPKDVVPYIEGEPIIGTVPVEPGLTNAAGERQGEKITGFNSENAGIHEGLVRFDIVFYVRIPPADGMESGLSQIIINVEAQKDQPSGYHLLNRAVFYVSRLISSQKERDFVHSNYNDIRRVFSIWLCMGMEENSMDYVHLTNDKLLGSCRWEGGLDLLNIVLVGLSDELPEHKEEYKLHRLLGALLSMDLSVEEKLDIVKTEYGIPIEDNIREDVSVMCNLSQGIKEKGRIEGMAEGKAEGMIEGKAKGKAEGKAEMIINMHKKGYTLEQIADVAGKSTEEIRSIIEDREPVLV